MKFEISDSKLHIFEDIDIARPHRRLNEQCFGARTFRLLFLSSFLGGGTFSSFSLFP